MPRSNGAWPRPGLPHTLLRSNAFMQNLLMLAPGIARTGGFASSAGSGRIGMVDARDVGAVAAEVAADPARHTGRTYRLSGPELVSYGDVAGVLSDVLGRPVTFRARSREGDQAEMIRAGLPPKVAGMNALAEACSPTATQNGCPPTSQSCSAARHGRSDSSPRTTPPPSPDLNGFAPSRVSPSRPSCSGATPTASPTPTTDAPGPTRSRRPHPGPPRDRPPPSTGDAVAAADRALRRRDADRARHSTEMEGGSVPADTQANIDRYVAGEIDLAGLEAVEAAGSAEDRCPRG